MRLGHRCGAGSPLQPAERRLGGGSGRRRVPARLCRGPTSPSPKTCIDAMEEPFERTDARLAPSRGCWGSLGREPADPRRCWESWPHCHDTTSCIGMYISMWSVKGHGMDTLRARPKGFRTATLATHHHTPPGRSPWLSRRRQYRHKACDSEAAAGMRNGSPTRAVVHILRPLVPCVTADAPGREPRPWCS